MQLPFADAEISHEDTGLVLVRPSERYLESYRAACAETWNCVHNRYILHDPACYDAWKTTIFETFENRYRGRDLPEGYYPSLMLWAVHGDDFVGAANIRLEQDSELIRYGGTLGYFVRTSQRGRGFGTAISLMAVEAAKRLGVHPIVITCQESNAASCALSEHLPYRRRERDVVDADGVVQSIWRFWITE